MAWINSSSTRYRLWRDTDRGILAGVCAGIAGYVGVEPIVVRLVVVLGLIFFFPPTIYASSNEDASWGAVCTAPADTFHSLKRKFADLEARLRQMEGQVASGD